MVMLPPDELTDLGRELETRIRKGRRLPVDPAVLWKLIELGKNLEAGPEEYAELLSASSSLSTKILSAVNSSWFGVRHPVTKLSQAVNLLGLVSVRMLAMTHCLAAFHEQMGLPEEILRQFWRASLIKAEAARYLAEQTDPQVADEAYLIALMEDIAGAMMWRTHPEFYDQRELTDPAQLCAAEVEAFGIDHTAAAALLAETMGLPASVCEAIACHHDRAALRQMGLEGGLVEAVYFASLFPHACCTWSAAEAHAVVDIIDRVFGGSTLNSPIDSVLMEIERRYLHICECVRPAGAEKVNLPALLAQAADEVADTAESLVGTVHTMMAPRSDDMPGSEGLV